MTQVPLSECVYSPDLMLFCVRRDIESIAEQRGFRVESFLVEGMGPADAVFVVLDPCSTCILYRYRFGSNPELTVVAGDPDCGDVPALAEAVAVAFGFHNQEIIMRP